MAAKKREMQLVLNAQCGDLQALGELLREVHNALLGYISRLVGRDDAEDVLQEVFLQACRKLGFLRDPELFRPWMYRIASRAAFAYLKRSRRWPVQCCDEAVIEELPAPVPCEPPRQVYEIPELLEKVSPASRAVLLLHYQHELTLEEVAAVLELNLGTVKSRLAYGLSCLRNILERK